MSSALRVASRWRRPFWRRVGPGRLIGPTLALLPVVFLLPLDAVPIFATQGEAVGVVVWIGGILLAFRTVGAGAVRDDALVWLYQKGRAPHDVALANLLLDVGLAKVYAAWWALAGVAVLPAGAGPLLGFLGLFFAAVASYSVASATIFALGAFGVERPNDFTVALILVSLLLPVALQSFGAEWLSVLQWLAPPLLRASHLAGAIQTRSLIAATEFLLHILLYCGAMIALGTAALSRWRPRI